MSADDTGRVYVLDAAHVHSGGPGRQWRDEPAPSVGSCGGLAIDAAGHGRVAAMWMTGCQETGPVAVNVARRLPGGGWSQIRTVGDNGAGDVAVSSRGVVYALVNQLDAGLSVARKRPGTAWSQPVTLDEQRAFGFHIEAAGSRTRAIWSKERPSGGGDVWTARHLRR